MMTVELTGILAAGDKYANNLQDEALVPALEELGQDIKDEARRNLVPHQSARNADETQRAQTHRARQYKRQQPLIDSIQVGVFEDRGEPPTVVIYVSGTEGAIGRRLEFGHDLVAFGKQTSKHVPAKPWMRPAYELFRPVAPSLLMARMQRWADGR